MQVLVSDAIAQGRDVVDPEALARQVTRYRSAALIGASQTRGRPGALARKHHALARRLLDRQEDYLRFTADLRAPPDQRHRARHPDGQARQEVSGCLRTLTGARRFCAIRSYLSTAAEHGLAFFGALVMLAEGRPWMPAAA